MATDDEIKLKLSLRGASQFRQDATRVSESIRRIGLSAQLAARHVEALGRALNHARQGTIGYTNAMRQAEAAVRRMELRVNRLTAELRRARAAQNGLNLGTRSSSSSLSIMSSRMSAAIGVATGLARAIAAVTAVTAAGTAAFVTYGLKAAGTMEQRQIGFSTILGSDQVGTEFLGQVNEFARNTPFDTQQVAAQAQFLMGTGTKKDDVLPTLEAIGNASSALNLDSDGLTSIVLALQQMRTKGTLSAEEINTQLAERGIDAWSYLADASGRSQGKVMKDAEAGRISGSQAADVVLRGLANDPQFKGAMDKQSRTFLGQLSNLKDTIWIESAKIFRPLTDELSKGIPLLTKGAGKALDWVGRKIGDIAPHVRELIMAFDKGGLDLVFNQLDNKLGAGGTLVRLWESVKSALPVFRSYLTGVAIPFMVQALPLVFDLLSTATEIATKGYSFLNDHGSSILTTFKILTVVLQASIAYLTDLYGVYAKIVSLPSKILGGAGSLIGKLLPDDGPYGSSSPMPQARNNTFPFGSSLTSPVRPQGPGLAFGGHVTRPGTVQVGERGREWLTLPAGATVRPLDNDTVSPSGMGGVVFQPGSVVISGADSADNRKLAKLVVNGLKAELARR